MGEGYKGHENKQLSYLQEQLKNEESKENKEIKRI